MIEKGDKVRFIDEALEGTVTSLLGKDKAEVLTADGFTLIALITQLVKVRTDKEEQSMTQQSITPPPAKQKEEPIKARKTRSAIFSFDEESLKEEMIFAAFQLIVPESPLTSAVQVHLINNTNLTIAFSLSRKYEMRDEGIAIDKMDARSIKSFFTYTQEELKLFESFRLQVIFHPVANVSNGVNASGKMAFRPSVQKQFRFNVNDLLESPDFIFGKTDCLLISISDLKQAPEVDITALVNKFSEPAKEGDATNNAKGTKSKRPSQNIIFGNEKIVDLHIEELLKDFTAMSNGQIIAHQLKHFQYEMDQAILNHLSSITFIHGVGAGVLKSAIREELKKFPNIKFGDAPVGKFGYGATEIIFL